MSEAALHPNEQARLRVLRELEILDTAEEAVFDDVVKMAAEICGVPIALISLIDDNRQWWFKAKFGLEASETPRCDAFCAHAILDSTTPLVVNDATEDDRFAANPLVTGDPGIRFYAGVPLTLDAELLLGTLCVISDQPKALTAEQLTLLEMLARQVESMFKVRQASFKVRETQNLLRRSQASLDSSADGVAWVSPEGKLLYVNKQFCKQLGYTVDELLSMTVADFNPAVTDTQLFEEKFWPEVVLSQNKVSELFHKRKDESVFPIEISAHLIDFDDVSFACCFVRDITDRKATEAKIANFADELEQANSELQQFATIASHDLKQPLRAISHLAQWAIEDGGDLMPDSSKQHLQKLQARVVRMGQLLDDLLNYSRVGSKKGAVESVFVRELVEQVLELIEIPEGFRIRFQGEFPTILTQQTPLSIIFRNLIGNAVKYRLKDDGEVLISAEVNSEGEHQFTVTDDGRGIDPDFHDYIFGMFSKLNPAEEIESSGMGLAIIAKLLKPRGGVISLKSSEGNGASFTFTWPV